MMDWDTFDASSCTCREVESLVKDDEPPSSIPCKPPIKIHGQDVEIAVRKEPPKRYPRRLNETAKEQKPIVVGSLYKAEKYIRPTPKCSPRFFLKGIVQILFNREGYSKKSNEDVWSLWKAYERDAADVFIYSNVDEVANIVLILSLSCKYFSQYQELFDKIMQRLQRGVYLGDVSKELRDVKKLTYFYSCLGLAIAEGHFHVQRCIASILGVWLENLINRRKMSARKSRCTLSSKLMKGSKMLSLRVPDSVLKTALEKSLLPTTIAQNIFRDVNIDSYLCTLQLLRLCCETSSVIRERLWCLPVLDSVFQRLSYPDPANRILIKSIDFVYSYFGVYTLYQNEGKTSKTVPRLRKESFQVLLQRFLQQLDTPEVPPKSLLGIRNDTGFLICLLGERIPFSGEYFSDHGTTIASIVTCNILGIDSDDVFTVTETDEDLEVLQFMICMLNSIIQSGRGEKILKKYRLVAVLLTLILGPCGLPLEEDALKGKNLHSAAWSTVLEIAKRYPLSLLTQHGVASLLTTLKAFGRTGEGNPMNLAMSLHTLRVMLTTTTMSFVENEDGEEKNDDIYEEVMEYFIEREAVATLLSVLHRLVSCKDFGALQDTMIGNALCCCSALGICDQSQKEAFVKHDGVQVLVILMRRHLTSDPLEKKALDSTLQIIVAECICSLVAYYPTALEILLDSEGVLQVLDVLETAVTSKAIVELMNCIVQLCDYQRCIHQLLCWKRPIKNTTQCYVFGECVNPAAKSLLFTAKDSLRSGDNLFELDSYKDLNLGSLLCSLWRDEEKRSEVQRDPDGCIASLSHPLMTALARAYEAEYEERNNVVDIIQQRTSIDMTNSSLRPKIYLLIKRIVEATNSTAALFDGLSLANQILVQVIINFMELKKSEIVTDMNEEMQQLGLKFAPQDEEETSQFLQVASNSISSVLETQRFLLQRFNENECMKETEFYSIVKQCRLQDHLLAAREIDFIARTTSYDYLVEKRLWQKQELEEAAKHAGRTVVKNTRIHRTSDGYLNITAWIRKKDLDSEPKLYEQKVTEVSLDDYEDNNGSIVEEGIEIEGEDEVDEADSSTVPSTSALEPSSALVAASNYVLMSEIASTSSAAFFNENRTPDATEGGFYQVSPYLLKQALTKVASFRQSRAWNNIIMKDDEENQWKIIRKWKRDWYPLDKIKRENWENENDKETEPRPKESSIHVLHPSDEDEDENENEDDEAENENELDE